MIAALLCGRKDSKGVPNKNIFPVLGRPLMWYPLQSALHSRHLERIYVSTDSAEIARMGREHGCRIIPRPAELATDEALLEEVIQHGYHFIKNDIGQDLECLVLLLCNAATVLAQNIDLGIEMLQADAEADSVTTVALLNQYAPIRAKKLVEGRLEPAIDLESLADTITCDRKCMGDVYFCDASLWIMKPSCMDYAVGQPPFRWMGKKILPIMQEGGLDVDDEAGLYATERWLRRHGFNAEKTPYDD